MSTEPLEMCRWHKCYGLSDDHPHQVSIPFPATPWDSDRWVILRDTMVWKHFNWMFDQGYQLCSDIWAWSNKPDAEMVYSFKDPSKALLFKLACGGNV